MSVDNMTNSYRERMARQIPLWGEAGQKKIASTSLTICGFGGNGSAFAFFGALAGFRKMNLVDNDKLKTHNLNRSMFGGYRDIGKYKVLIAKEKLNELFPDMEITAYPEDIRTLGIWEQVRNCDWMTDATDNDETRHFLNRKCREDNIPLISLASGFTTRDGKLTGAGCRVNRVRQGDACLASQVLDEEPMEHAQISLVVPNVIVAAMALDILLRELTGYAPASDNKNFIMFDLINRTITSERVIPSPRCLYCGQQPQERIIHE